MSRRNSPASNSPNNKPPSYPGSPTVPARTGSPHPAAQDYRPAPPYTSTPGIVAPTPRRPGAAQAAQILQTIAEEHDGRTSTPPASRTQGSRSSPQNGQGTSRGQSASPSRSNQVTPTRQATPTRNPTPGTRQVLPICSVIACVLTISRSGKK
ncbi:hypothetical protein ACEPAH_6503 [Sanghuangporus vaninii]